MTNTDTLRRAAVTLQRIVLDEQGQRILVCLEVPREAWELPNGPTLSRLVFEDMVYQARHGNSGPR